MKMRFLHLIVILSAINFHVNATEPLSLDIIYKQGKFYPVQVQGVNSMNNGIHYSVLINNREVRQYDYHTGLEQEVLFSCDWDNSGELPLITSYTFSNDENIILLAGQKEKLYRYSYYSSYYTYNRNSGLQEPVYKKAKQRAAALSPDGEKVAFVVDNNLYIKNIESGRVTQITKDGKRNQIINGVPDWVYEEEFTLLTGFAWSPDSRKIAYYRFDESEVKEYQLTYYANLYPREYSYKYPKAGESNALVDIYVYDIERSEAIKMHTGDQTDRYIPRIKWLPNSAEICILVLNRRQNKADYYIANTNSGTSTIFHTESDKKYLIEFTDDFINFISENEVLLVSDKDGYTHIYRYGLDGNKINQVTKGNWEIDEFLGYSVEKQKIYFSSTEESPLQRNVYSVNLDGSGKRKLTIRKGVNRAKFSKNFEYFVLTYSNANLPHVTGIYDGNGNHIRTIENNKQVNELTSEFGFTEKRFFQFVNRTSDSLYGYEILPPEFDTRKKYPVLLYTYGGPELQKVTDEWQNNLPWFQLLAQQGYVVVCFDNRGTAGRGEAFKKSVYLQLGKLETEDHIDLVKYLHSLDYIDKERIGVFGWSYGGYMSLLCLTKAADYFKMGIAVAPVTNWRFYDTIYTERYMRKPQENAEGYDSNSPINFINLLRGKLLLIHGMTDDNVHFQNSAMLVKSLVDNNKQFDMQFYPDKNHSIYGGNTTYHVYTRITNYILENL